MPRFRQDHGLTCNPRNRQTRALPSPRSSLVNRAKRLLQATHFQQLATVQEGSPSKPRRCSHLPQSHTRGGPPFYRCGFESDEFPDCGVLVLAGGGVLAPAGGVDPACGVVVPGGGVVPCGGVVVPGGGVVPLRRSRGAGWRRGRSSRRMHAGSPEAARSSPAHPAARRAAELLAACRSG